MYFISDLDGTLIHSKVSGYTNVEVYNGKPITFMTDKSIELLNKICEKAKFIPCTMRNLRQTMRISVVNDLNPEYIICCNGAQIYVNGIIDENYEHKMRSLVDKQEVLDLINAVDKLNIDTVKDIRNIEDYYVGVYFTSTEEAINNIERLKSVIPSNYKIERMKYKVFLISESINKKNALLYLKDKCNMEHIYTSGDNEVDRDFTSLDCVKAYLPAHLTFNHNESAYITSKYGIEATDEILEEILKDINIKAI